MLTGTSANKKYIPRKRTDKRGILQPSEEPVGICHILLSSVLMTIGTYHNYKCL